MAMLPSLSRGRSAGRPLLPGVSALMDEFFDDTQMLPWGLFSPFAGNQMMRRQGDDGQLSSQGRRTQLGGIPVDVVELGDHFELHASLPGVKKEQVKLEVDGDCITVAAEVSQEKTYTSPEGAAGEQEAGAKWHRQERVKEYASRCLRMPDTADLQNISAKMEDGVLSVSVAKKEEFAAKQRRIAIE